MQSVKPLRLKRQAYRSATTADSRTVVNVWVDSGLSHLDGIYSYRCPNELLGKISIGSRLKVPFNSRSCEALVVEILETNEVTEHFKIIESALGDIPVANSAVIQFYRLMAQHWASDPYSLIKFGIPSRVASVEKNIEPSHFEPDERTVPSKRSPQSYYMMHTPHKSAYLEIIELAIERMKNGSTLLLLPDTKDIDRVLQNLEGKSADFEVIRLDSSLPRAQRYENYLKISIKSNVLVIGNRSALFAPIQNLTSIIVAFEKSEQYFE